MDNSTIADNFSLLSKLMDIHGDNSFKAKSYSVAAYTIDKLPMPLLGLAPENIFTIKGIGDAIGKKVLEQLQTGRLQLLQDYLAKTPEGIVAMLGIKGIGPKKVSVIWNEMEIETIGELLYACNENRLTLFKGFGEKTQQSIKESIEFYLGTLGSYLYGQIESYALAWDDKFKQLFAGEKFAICGEYRRQMEVIEKLEWVTTLSIPLLKDFFTGDDYAVVAEEDNYIAFKGKENVHLGFYCSNTDGFYSLLFKTSCSDDFLKAWNDTTHWDDSKAYTSEEEIFLLNPIAFIPAYERESAEVLQLAIENKLPTVIVPDDINGIIHSHSTWSDGVHMIEQMAKAAIEKGYSYLLISDHSKSAFYAKGLGVDRLIAQQQEIDALNSKLAPFKIFKGIESDILSDGNLDYEDKVLNTFDVVIASIHSNLKMSEEKAMMRLLNAIKNPYTSILGHLTGRLLLSRNGYPVNHKIIIDACAANNVVIELNAHPRRLDIDWRWIAYALSKNVLISIDPDAHSIDGFNDCRYGVLVAQKAGLRKENNLSSFSLEAFEEFVRLQKGKRK